MVGFGPHQLALAHQLALRAFDHGSPDLSNAGCKIGRMGARWGGMVMVLNLGGGAGQCL